MAKRRSDEDTITVPLKRFGFREELPKEVDILKFQKVPSLKHIASVHIITTLWKRDKMSTLLKQSLSIPGYKEFKNLDINVWRDFIQLEFSKSMHQNMWKKTVKIISDTVADLDLRIPSLNDLLIDVNKIFVSESLKTWMMDMSEVLHCWPNSEGKAADYIKYTVWTPIGTINNTETARSLVLDSDLSNDEKYLIACNSCLEEEVICISSKVNHRAFQTHTETSLHVTRWPMIHYWNSSIRNNSVDRDRAPSNIRNQMFHLVQLAKSKVLSRDESAIKYFWNKLNEDKKLKAAKLIVSRTSDISLLYYFMFQLEYEDRQKLLSHCFPNYIKKLMEDKIHGNQFLPIIHRFWDRMEKKKYISILEHVARQMRHTKKSKVNEMCRYKHIFVELWTHAPRNLKTEICADSDNLSHILFFLPWKRNKDILRMIFSELEDEQRKKLMESSSLCRQKVTNFINKEKWEVLDASLSLIFRSKEETFMFKKSLIKEKGLILAESFISNGSWDKEREFLNWFFATETLTLPQNKKLLNKYICDKLSVCLDVIENCQAFKYFVNWGNDLQEDVRTFMAGAQNRQLLVDVTLTFINRDRLMECNKFITWCFFEDSAKVNEFKLFFYTTCKDDLVETIARRFRGENSLDFLINLEYWLFEEKPKRNQFKLELLNSRIWCALVCQVDLELANKFLKWCFQGNMDNVNEFKYREFNGEEMPRILQIYYNVYGDRRSLQLRLIEWFNPPEDVVKKHKKLFLTNTTRHFAEQYKEILKIFITNRTYLDGYPKSISNRFFI